MRFAIVEFLCEETCAVIQQSWLDSTKKKCYFPPNKSFAKTIQKENSKETVEQWKQYEIKIIKENIGNYEQAKNLAKYTSEFGDTDGENLKRQEKEMKRKRVILGETLDLRNEMKKAKIDDSSATFSQENIEEEQISMDSNTSSDALIRSNSSPANEPTNNTNSPRVEYTDINRESFILMELKKYIDDAKKEICQKIDIALDEISNIKLRLGYTATENFDKIKSTKKFNNFIEMMKVQVKKENLIQTLEKLPDTTNSKNNNHGRIATMIEYLFDAKFIVKRLKWGEMNGQEKSTRTIYLVNHGIFFEIASALLPKVAPKDIRASFQIYFKHRVKKLASE